MASRLANKILFKGCISAEGEKAARGLQEFVRDSQILLNADEPVKRFLELDSDGPRAWNAGSELPNVSPPSPVEKLFVECRLPEDLPSSWETILRAYDIDSWGVSLSYQDLIRYYSENGDGDDARRAAHGRAREVLGSHLSRGGAPQEGQPSASLLPFDSDSPAPRWLLESELFLDLAGKKSVLAGAYGMDGVVLEDGSFAALDNGERALYYRTTPQALEADVAASSAELAAAAARYVASLYIPLLTTLCLTHHEASPPLSYLAGVAPSSGKAKGGISSSTTWRTLDTAPVEGALENEGGLRRAGLRSALVACSHRFRS